MYLLCTSSDAASQFVNFDGAASAFNVAYLDRPYDIQLSKDNLIVWQDGRELSLDRTSSVVYLLFRDPHEGIPDTREALGRAESFELLEDGCEIVGVKMVNPPASWRRAYLKSALLRVSARFPGLVPSTQIVSGTSWRENSGHRIDRLVKCGFGVRRTVEERYPRATLLPSEREFTPAVSYRYVVQDFIGADREVRSYVTCGAADKSVNAFEMPIGSGDCPDWRDSTPANQLSCKRVRDKALERLSIYLATELDLNFVCFDFLFKEDRAYLIDINPHGSWIWLPQPARDIVDQQVESWLESLVKP